MKVNGQAIKDLRQQAGLTQEQLASDAGISRAHLASLERGRRGATSLVIRRIGRALGLKTSGGNLPKEIVSD